MSAMEFAEWKAVFTAEQLHPAAARARHAQLMACAMNGAVTRRDRRFWRASDLTDADPWARWAGSPVQTRAQAPSAAQLAAQVARLNAFIKP